MLKSLKRVKIIPSKAQLSFRVQLNIKVGWDFRKATNSAVPLNVLRQLKVQL